jgi:3-phosphoshikimate 1-carboxyvinyltransferase
MLLGMKSVRKTSKTDVVVEAPPSKAHTLRALFMSALAEGRSLVRNPLLGEDQQRAIECLQRLGVDIAIQDKAVIVVGKGGRFEPVSEELNVGESGVSMNFLAALACLASKPVVITGAPRILERPVGEIVSGMRQLGCGIEYLGEEGFPPIRVFGGGIPGGKAEIRGELTSQYFSAILAAAPCADRPVELRCIGPMSEKPYLAITLDMMSQFGVHFEREDFNRFVVQPQSYASREYTVEGDYSSAAFFFEAAAICGIKVTVLGLNPDSLQADRRFLSLLAEMCCDISVSENAVTVKGGSLRAVQADMSDSPDLVPPLAVTAAFARGTSRLTNIGHLRHKECDRLAVTVSELTKMGADASCDEDSITIHGGRPLHGARIDPHNDHRIAMAFAIAGLAVGDQTIEDEACVAKSFPDFSERLRCFC